MFFKNLIAKLITVNTPSKTAEDGSVIRGDAYKLLPAGPAVEIPDAVIESSEIVQRFLESRIKKGFIVEIGESVEKSDGGGGYSKMKVDELRALAEGLEIEGADGMKRLNWSPLLKRLNLPIK